MNDRLRRGALLLAAALMLGGCVQRSAASAADDPGTMTLLLPRIGKADCSICTDGAAALMIDCGEADDAAELLQKLDALDIRRLDLLVITHFDKDHIGSAAALLGKVEIGCVIEPDYVPEDPDAAEYVAYREALADYGGEHVVLSGERTLTFGSMELTVRGAGSADYDKNTDNNHSLFVTLTHAGNRFLFSGDAEKQRLRDELDRGVAGADFLKVPHHGHYNAALPEFFAAVHPAFAAITCSAKNPPDSDTLAELAAIGCTVRLTADGDVRLLSTADGISIP